MQSGCDVNCIECHWWGSLHVNLPLSCASANVRGTEPTCSAGVQGVIYVLPVIATMCHLAWYVEHFLISHPGLLKTAVTQKVWYLCLCCHMFRRCCKTNCLFIFSFWTKFDLVALLFGRFLRDSKIWVQLSEEMTSNGLPKLTIKKFGKYLNLHWILNVCMYLLLNRIIQLLFVPQNGLNVLIVISRLSNDFAYWLTQKWVCWQASCHAQFAFCKSGLQCNTSSNEAFFFNLITVTSIRSSSRHSCQFFIQ